ncbi:MAG: SAM-dependent methyltransferase [Micrococcales bacterium 70-64]|nr:methyltransferase [Leifsonia sp.]ODU63774.1 MAG: SAM-dependent methyltransferase [Leifsonia sp. SCN 70-46]OJX85465.1 MAG: SAM-dependent methyltransferase [Micrococcales bacterium 70-64]
MNLDTLRRRPDLEAPELRAWDAADTLILDEAPGLAAASGLTIIGDEYGALTLGALEAGASGLRVHQDSLAGERAIAANLGDGDYRLLPLAPELVEGATLVLLRLPRSLDALEQIAALIAAHASPHVVVVAGGRLKHMSVSMNEVLLRHFDTVDVTHARQKSRVLVARAPRPGGLAEPRRQRHDGLWVVATGGVFAGTSIDIGTRALLGVLDKVPPFESAVDLGCGTGILAATLSRLNPAARVLASDRSAAAVESARLTMQANGLDVRVTRDDALGDEPDGSVDLVVLNPPFHSGAAVHPGVSTALFAAAGRVLRPGGELWAVWNSHLQYRPTLERLVGTTRQIARTPKFTITASRKGS